MPRIRDLIDDNTRASMYALLDNLRKYSGTKAPGKAQSNKKGKPRAKKESSQGEDV